MQVNPLHPLFAAEIVGADLAGPTTPELVQTVEDAMARYAVCVVRGASLDDDDHIRFSRAFGPLELPPGSSRRGIAPELDDVTNLGAEAEVLLDELYAFATQDRFVYSHQWRQGDLVIWDNRCSLHRATPFDRQRYKRDCRRTTVNEYGEERMGTTEVQAA